MVNFFKLVLFYHKKKYINAYGSTKLHEKVLTIFISVFLILLHSITLVYIILYDKNSILLYIIYRGNFEAFDGNEK